MGAIFCTELRKLVLVISSVLTVQCVLLVWPVIATAEDSTKTWSWSTIKPTVFNSSPIDSVSGSDTCATSYQSKDIAGEIGVRQTCMTTGENVNFGMYFTGHGYQPTISFAYDTKMYKVFGAPCEQSLTCRYLPGSDTLVTSQHVVNNYVRSLVVYKNFTKRLTRTLNRLLPIIEYSFDSSNPDYIFKGPSGYAWPVGGFGGSDDGKWLAVEFRQRGIGLLNVETLEMKRISTQAFSYGTGYDPASEIAVSNGGRHVAIMGSNVGLTVYDINSGCGDVAVDENMGGVKPIQYPCKVASIDTEGFIHRFWGGSHPRFNDDGSELRFYAISYLRELREVTLRTDGYINQRVDYLAMGDSFSSGEGETDDKYYINGTNDRYEKCHTSTRSYPYLIAKALGIETQYVKSVACSGAVTGDIVGDDKLYQGQNKRLADKDFNLSGAQITTNKSAAKELFIPGRVHQNSFVNIYQPKVITVGIGGNDAGFMEKLKTCLGTDTCAWAGTAIGREKSALEVKALFGTLVNTYTEIHNASPNSKIYAIGYPKIIDPDGKCDLLHGKLLDTAEKEFMDKAIVYINRVVAAAAQKAGIKYIDIENSFDNQALCGTTHPIVMNGIRIGDDFSVSANTDWFKVIGQESFHPRPTGHTKTTERILKAVPNILNYTYCTEGIVVCPSNTVAPTPSSYWLVDGQTHDYASQHIAYFTKDQDGATNQRQKTISMASFSFVPNSVIKTEIQSQPVALGDFVADSIGGIKFNVELPKDLEEGFHTLHLYGTSYSGEPIDLYEVIKYELPVVTNGDTKQESAPTLKSDELVAATKLSTQYVAELIGSSDIDVLGATAKRTSEQFGSATAKQGLGDTDNRIKPTGTISISTNGYIIPSLALLILGGVYFGYNSLRRNK